MSTFSSRLVVMAHQGCQGLYPSNSLGAITKAFDLAEEVEFDVYRVKSEGDDKIICCHPETYFLFVSKHGMQNSGDFPYEECQQYRWQETKLMPDLEEVLDAWASSQRLTSLQIELKGPHIPAVLVPLLLERVEKGLLDLEKISLTGLCYPEDRSRITEVRSRSERIRLVLPLRGDWQQDGFESFEDAVQFAREQNVWMVTIQRRLLQPYMVSELHSAGLVSGTFHGRTSDEFEAALALGVRYVAADRFEAPTVEAYGNVCSVLSLEVYSHLYSSGFYQLRDWIWELGWLLEKEVRTNSFGAHLLELPVAIADADATCVIDVEITLRLFDSCSSSTSGHGISLTDWQLPQTFLGEVDRVHGKATQLLDIVSIEGVEETLRKVLGKPVPLSMAIQWAENVESGSDSTIEAIVSREVLIRAGRIIGMIAFSALNPRHTEKEVLSVGISATLCSSSPIAQRAAREQIEAQLLRSGIFSASIMFC